MAILSDILGDEDHLGDMDFKVAGTAEGVTALQMDIKIGGVTKEIMQQALKQARAGRLHFLGKMAETLSAARAEFTVLLPRITTSLSRPTRFRDASARRQKYSQYHRNHSVTVDIVVRPYNIASTNKEEATWLSR